MTEPYPLEVLRGMRERDVDAAQEKLACAIRDAERLELAAARASQEVAAHKAETARVLADEDARDLAGRTLDAALRAQAWGRRRATEQQAHVARAERARAELRAAQAQVEGARAELAQARAEREAVEKHKDRWDGAKRKAAEKKEENEADERASSQSGRD